MENIILNHYVIYNRTFPHIPLQKKDFHNIIVNNRSIQSHMSNSTATTTAASSLRITESRNELTTDIDVIDSNGIIINVEDCIASDDDDNTSCCDKEENIFVKRHNSEVDINDVIVSSTVVNDVGDDEEKILEKEEEEPGQTNERNELNLALYSTSTVNPNNNNDDDGLAMVHNFLLDLQEGD